MILRHKDSQARLVMAPIVGQPKNRSVASFWQAHRLSMSRNAGSNDQLIMVMVKLICGPGNLCFDVCLERLLQNALNRIGIGCQ